MAELLKLMRLRGNRGQGTRLWHQILQRKWKYGLERWKTQMATRFGEKKQKNTTHCTVTDFIQWRKLKLCEHTGTMTDEWLVKTVMVWTVEDDWRVSAHLLLPVRDKTAAMHCITVTITSAITTHVTVVSALFCNTVTSDVWIYHEIIENHDDDDDDEDDDDGNDEENVIKSSSNHHHHQTSLISSSSTKNHNSSWQ